MTPTELNKAVATALGWTDLKEEPQTWRMGTQLQGVPPGLGPKSYRVVPDYSGDIAAAWGLVESMRVSEDFVRIDNHGAKEWWEVTLSHTPGPIRESSKSAPEAICRAFLAAKGHH
jgi:hypothetical protein